MTYTWQPSEDYLRNSNVARLMRTLDCATVDELRARSVADISSFWETVIRDLGIEFARPYRRIVDLSAGVADPVWFPGGELNIVDACLGRWVAATPGATAVVHENEAGEVSTLSYAELADRVARVRAGLRSLGVGKGDAVAIYLPMTPEAVIATYAVASIGAMVVPLFSGFAATAIASRLADAEVKLVFTADGTLRRGKVAAMLPQLEQALGEYRGVRHVVAVNNLPGGASLPQRLADAEVVSWTDLLGRLPDARVEPTAADDVLLLAYTSGTTGKPKGAVHTHAGFLLRVASEVAYGFDLSRGRTFCWITDMGWIMGPLSIIGTHANGGTLLLYEGSPDTPDASRLWSLVERHQVAMLGVSPTLIRSLRSAGTATQEADLGSVRTLGSTGEPWDPDSYEWLARDVFDSRVPVINFSGGTEVGGSFLSPYPAEPISSCSLGGPALGMDVDVVDDQASSLRGSIGELVCRQTWPSMTRGVWKDDARYRESYWSTFPGLWRHGDYALVDDEGNWFILGRSDDVMNVAGKRVAPAEIESVLSSDPAVAECAVVGIPHETKGEAVWAFWVAREGMREDTDAVATRLRAAVATEVGKPFAPQRVLRVEQLPKTRSAKILRRAVRAAVLDTDPGDLSGAENPEAVAQIRDVVSAQAH